ncbi:hypothetical protein C0992_012087 [Termitomyces sp. T32_za158]|nr:hypothetical protein C0992_012087 [Termitomyces sp. T32_za158]
MLYNYKPTQAAACLESKPVVFIGDSVARTLFFQLAHLLDPSLPLGPTQNGEKHANHTLTIETGNSVSFFWDPFLNSTHTFDVVRSARDDRHRPALLVLGSGLWYLRYANSSGGLPSWEVNMEHLLAEIVKSPVRPADQVVVLPVEQVVPSKLSPERAMSMHLSDIDAMNSDLMHRIHPPYSGLPFSSRPASPVSLPLVFNEMLVPSQTEDGLHFSGSVVKTQAQILLNLRCNNLMPKQFPLDKTCCNMYPWPSFLHLSILLVIFSWGPILAFMSYRAGSEQISWLKEAHNPALVFSVGVALIFFADRSGLWLKEQKQYDHWTFTFLCLVAMFVGLATIKRSDKDLGFMNREQTDEWKGWMQRRQPVEA